MQVKDWSGGRNIRVDKTLIGPTESIKYDNCDNEAGILKPTRKPVNTQENIGKFHTYFEASNLLVSSNIETYWVEYREVLYSMSVEGAFKSKDGVTTNLGIAKPMTSPSISTTTNTNIVVSLSNIIGFVDDVPIPALDFLTNPIDEVPKTLIGTYRYVYTYYNSLTGIESAPSGLSNELEVDTNAINVGAIVASSDPQVDTIRLYRIGGTLTNYNLVAELPNGITQSFQDDYSDWSIAGNYILESFRYTEPLPNGKYLTEAYAMLFAAYGDKLYYSEIGKPDAWPRTYFIDFEDEITGIGSTQHGLLVFTKYKTYIVTGNSPTTFSRYLLNGEQGCISHHSIAYVDNSLMWVSTDGICASNGGAVEIVTQKKLGKQSLRPINAVVFDKMYILALEESTLIFDFRYNGCVRDLTYTGWVNYFNDSVYMEMGGDLYELFKGDPDTMEYHSGVLTFAGFSSYQTSKDVYIAYSGEVYIRMWLHTETNKKLIANRMLPIDRTQYNLKTKEAIAGYGISYTIHGTGKVYEIDFVGVNKNAD